MENDEKKQEAIHLYDFQPKTIAFMSSLITYTPHIFHDISDEIEKILSKGSISLHDILPLITSIKNIYNIHIHSIQHYNITIEQGIDFIETLLILLIHEKILPIDETQKEMILYTISWAVHLLESTVFSKQSFWSYILSIKEYLSECFYTWDEEEIPTGPRRLSISRLPEENKKDE